MSCSSNFLKNVAIYQNPWFSFLSELIYIEILNCLETIDCLNFLGFLLLQLPRYSTSQLYPKKTYEDSWLCYQYCVILCSWPSSKGMGFCGVFVWVSCGVSHEFLRCMYKKGIRCDFLFIFMNVLKIIAIVPIWKQNDNSIIEIPQAKEWSNCNRECVVEKRAN